MDARAEIDRPALVLRPEGLRVGFSHVRFRGNRARKKSGALVEKDLCARTASAIFDDLFLESEYSEYFWAWAGRLFLFAATPIN